MALRWRFLDNIDGDRADKSLSVTSKWWAFGTRDELLAWLPLYKANANFALLDSEDALSGTRWCPDSGGGATVYAILNTRFTALDRFEWQVYVTAIDFSKGSSSGGGGNFSFPDKSKLATEETYEMVLSDFTITEQMAGQKLVAGVYGTIPGWTAGTDRPFNEAIPQGYINRTLKLYIQRKQSYLSGTPLANDAVVQAFTGIIPLFGTIVNGLVVQNDARIIYDTNKNTYTEWIQAVRRPPPGFTWNPLWKEQ